MSEDFDPIYQEYILDLYRHPLNAGVLSGPDAEAEDVNPSCGDQIRVMARLDGGVIAEIKHSGVGCAISQAAVSLVTENVKGKSRADVLAMSGDDAVKLLNIPISHTRLKCATLGLRVLQKSLL